MRSFISGSHCDKIDKLPVNEMLKGFIQLRRIRWEIASIDDGKIRNGREVPTVPTLFLLAGRKREVKKSYIHSKDF